MRRWAIVRRCTSLLAAAVLAGCGGRARTPAGVTPRDSAATPDISLEAAAARGVVALFVVYESEGNAAADTLLAPGADFIMTGVKVTTRPRLAGLNGPGQASVEEASLGLAGNFGWEVALYRFAGRTPELNERARATFILEKQRAGWKIRHVHSSMVARW